MTSRRTLPRAVIALSLAAVALVTIGSVFVRLRGADPYLTDIQMAAQAGSPTLSELKRIASAMILSDPDLKETDSRLATLGRRLFFDARLSSNQHISCATCHKPDKFFTDGLAVGEGLAPTTRNTPTVVNSFTQYWFFWDGRADSLAAQALQPIEDEREHGFTRIGVVRLILEHYRDEYEALFGALPDELLGMLPLEGMPLANQPEYSRQHLEISASSVTAPMFLRQIADSGDPVTAVLRMQTNEEPSPLAIKRALAFDQIPEDVQTAVNRVFVDVGLALAAWQKTLVANESPFDRFAKSWTSDKTDSRPSEYFLDGFGSEELLGLQIFVGKGGCNLCHTGPTLSDHQFHNIGLPQRGELLELGRARGLALVQNDPFNCRAPFWPSVHAESESCKDLSYLDKNSPEAIGAFKTPSLRSVALTAPYMHDGRFKTLASVIDHYDRMDTMPAVGYREETLRPLGLSLREKDALQAFLKSLTSAVREVDD